MAPPDGGISAVRKPNGFPLAFRSAVETRIRSARGGSGAIDGAWWRVPAEAVAGRSDFRGEDWREGAMSSEVDEHMPYPASIAKPAPYGFPVNADPLEWR